MGGKSKMGLVHIPPALFWSSFSDMVLQELWKGNGRKGGHVTCKFP